MTHKGLILFVLFSGVAAMGLLSCSGGSSLDGGQLDAGMTDRVIADHDGDGGGSGCIECHTAPPDGGSWRDAPGDHDRCEQCHTGDHGWSPDPPESVCLNCHQRDWEDEHPSGAVSCLACHVSPHIPQENQCRDCHTVPPEKPGDSWSDAPSGHRDCWACHDGDHGWSPSPPESVCLNCHQGEWEDKHNSSSTQCLSCHLWQHVPLDIRLKRGIHEDHSSEGVQCYSCHRMMGGMMPDRARCLACHTLDETRHSRGALCRICHKS